MNRPKRNSLSPNWHYMRICASMAALLLFAPAHAAVTGITGIAGTPTFNLTASADRISQPDGNMIYTWGYGCTTAPTGFAPASLAPLAFCSVMQLPGPTLIVHEGDTVTVNLTNHLPALAGNASIVFSGYQTCSATLNPDGTCTGTPTGVPGLLTQEAANGGVVTYTFKAAKPGTYAYYSGTQSELQIEMGLYGALVVLPGTPPANCTSTNTANSLSTAAYDHPQSCYDREYLFQFSEMNSDIHQQVENQVLACAALPVGQACPAITAPMDPYHPNYFLINGRSMPDDMDAPYAPNYPRQPYNGNPHMHPGELVLMRVVGHGRWQHPFHFHGNHARVLARDGNLLLAQNDPLATATNPPRLAGPLLFTYPTVSGQSVDMIFTWTGQGLNWDVYGLTNPHTCNGKPLPATPGDPSAQSAGFDPVTHEWCADHGKPIPVTPPDPQIVANGLWYGGTPYLGLQAVNPTPLPPGQSKQNMEAGYAYMWHSHDEREITTNDVFPGGMMMMLIIDPPGFVIDETL